MPAFEDPLQPVARVGEYVKLEPSGKIKKVEAVEQMAEIGPVDYGAAASGSAASENSSEIIKLNDELEMNRNTLGQFIISPISNVEVEVRQTGQQDSRFKNRNQVGKITMHTHIAQRTVWTYSDLDLQAIITNKQSWDMAKTLIHYTGYKLKLSDETYTEDQLDGMAGTPASVPVDSLNKQPGAASP